MQPETSNMLQISSFFDTTDIDGSAPSVVSFASKTSRNINPLNPQYAAVQHCLAISTAACSFAIQFL